MCDVKQYNKDTNQWEDAIPLPYYHSLFKWMWLRITRYRDEYDLKAQLWLGD